MRHISSSSSAGLRQPAGHLADGSSVQTHSAGPLYPFVVRAHDIAPVRYWEVIGPGINIDGRPMALRFCDEGSASAAAAELVQARVTHAAYSRAFSAGLALLSPRQAMAACEDLTYSSPQASPDERVRSLVKLAAYTGEADLVDY